MSHDPYASRFYPRFRAWSTWCVRRRWLVIGVTVAAFVASVLLFRFVPQQFFPDSTRLELMVDMELAEGASLRATDQRRRKQAGEAARARARTSTTTSPTSAPVRRASTCRSTSSCRRRTSRSSCVTRQGHRGARRGAQLADRGRVAALPRTAAARDAPGERPAGRLSGAVPRLRRAHRARARASPTRSRRRCARIRTSPTSTWTGTSRARSCA